MFFHCEKCNIEIHPGMKNKISQVRKKSPLICISAAPLTTFKLKTTTAYFINTSFSYTLYIPNILFFSFVETD